MIPKSDRGAWALVGLMFATAALLLLAPGCASALTSATAVLNTGTAAINAFEKYDDAHQLAIVAAAKTREEGDKNLASYRAARAPLFQVAGAAAFAAARGQELIAKLKAKQVPESEVRLWVTAFLPLLSKLQTAVGELGGAPQ